MTNSIRCSCRRCTIRSLMGPAVLIVLGLLFLLSEMRGGYFSFRNTFPIILIVIGAISLASSMASTDGHISAVPPGAPGTIPQPPQNPLSGQRQGQ
ncbi:MAG TPA: DUF5668 domain-containing protein [Candidatus Acidoferrum sp.]|jgi:hypothetical protein|nr:DUF5668 domain-containing protein [Candidatus Acidoferrum sp.]